MQKRSFKFLTAKFFQKFLPQVLGVLALNLFLLLALFVQPVLALDFADYSLEVTSEKFELTTNQGQVSQAAVYFYNGNIIDAAQFETSDHANFSAGYCSGNDCLNMELERLALKIDNGTQVESYWFSYENDQLALEFSDISTQLDLDNDEQQWLLDPTNLDQVIVTNPDLCPACGLDIALVLDSSGSISNSELNQMKQAFKDFVDAFLPNTPSKFAVIEFDSTAWLLQDFSNQADVVKSAIDQAQSGGMTNWQAALQQTQALDFAASSKPDLVVFASDGQPTYPQASTSTNLSLARQVANELKLDGIRILTLGIGNNLSSDNLSQISGPVVDGPNMLESDVVTTDFDQLTQDLSDLAYELCAGKILAQVQIDGNADGDLDDDLDLDGTVTSDFLLGWLIEITGSPTVNDETDETGFSEFELDPHTYVLTGAQSQDFTLQSMNCLQDGQPVGQVNGYQAENLALGIDDTLVCYLVYEPNEPWSHDDDNTDDDNTDDDNSDPASDDQENTDNSDADNDQVVTDDQSDDTDSAANDSETDDDNSNDDNADSAEAGASAQLAAGQVLGVSTQELPATGLSLALAVLPMIFMVAGLILILNEQRYQK